MSEVNLSVLRDMVERNASPYKVVRRDAVQYVGNLREDEDLNAPYEGYGQNVYRVDGTEVLVNDMVSRQLDEIIGLTPKQEKVVRNASGETGVRDFRNYLATAGSMFKPVSLALIANPSSRTVSGMIPIKEEPIPADAFFDFPGTSILKDQFDVAENSCPPLVLCYVVIQNKSAIVFAHNYRFFRNCDELFCISCFRFGFYHLDAVDIADDRYHLACRQHHYQQHDHH